MEQQRRLTQRGRAHRIRGGLSISILIPLADGHKIPYAVLRAIAMQTVECDIVPISRPGGVPSKRASEFECRNLLRQYATDQCIMMDRTCLFSSDHDVADAISAIESRPDMDGLVYNIKGPRPEEWWEMDKRNGHIAIGCIIIRAAALQRFTFGQLPGETERCLCRKLNREMKIDWVDHRILTEAKE